MLRNLTSFGIGRLAAFTTAAPAAPSAAEKQIRLSAAVCALALLPCFLGPAMADADDETVDIGQISCREMLKMEGEERDLTLIFIHGFVSGENAAPELDELELSDATETILDTCIDNPSESVLSVFHKVRG